VIYVVKTRLLYDHHILAEPTEKMNISLAILLRQRNCFLFLLIGFWYLARQRPPETDGEGGQSQEQREERLFQGEAQGEDGEITYHKTNHKTGEI
jgi:hypothetical protein